MKIRKSREVRNPLIPKIISPFVRKFKNVLTGVGEFSLVQCGCSNSKYTGSLAWISVMLFSILCIFKYSGYAIKLKNSFSHAFLVTNDFSVADLVHVDFWCEQGIITRCV